MLDAYDRVAVKVSNSFGLQLGARMPEPPELELSAYNLRMLASLAAGFADTPLPTTDPSSPRRRASWALAPASSSRR